MIRIYLPEGEVLWRLLYDLLGDRAKEVPRHVAWLCLVLFTFVVATTSIAMVRHYMRNEKLPYFDCHLEITLGRDILASFFIVAVILALFAEFWLWLG